MPGEVAVLKKLGLEVIVEKGAGEKAFAFDEAYIKAGDVVAEHKEVI